MFDTRSDTYVSVTLGVLAAVAVAYSFRPAPGLHPTHAAGVAFAAMVAALAVALAVCVVTAAVLARRRHGR